MRLISTRTGGIARRSFINGNRLWPPARTLASVWVANRSTASATDCGAAYLNEAGITDVPPRGRDGTPAGHGLVKKLWPTGEAPAKERGTEAIRGGQRLLAAFPGQSV